MTPKIIEGSAAGMVCTVGAGAAAQTRGITARYADADNAEGQRV